MRRAREAAAAVLFGQDTVIEQTLITLLAGGHALLIGVPGLGKTRLVDALGSIVGAAPSVEPVHIKVPMTLIIGDTGVRCPTACCRMSVAAIIRTT